MPHCLSLYNNLLAAWCIVAAHRMPHPLLYSSFLAATLQAEPRATEYIPAMVASIERIIAHGHAYALPDGDVYFEVASLPGYGRLSGRAQVRGALCMYP